MITIAWNHRSPCPGIRSEARNWPRSTIFRANLLTVILPEFSLTGRFFGCGNLAVGAYTPKELILKDVHFGRGFCAPQVTPDGQRAVSASSDQTLKVWDRETEEAIVTFTCDDGAFCCAFSEALKLILAGDAGGHLHLLRLEEAKPTH